MPDASDDEEAIASAEEAALAKVLAEADDSDDDVDEEQEESDEGEYVYVVGRRLTGVCTTCHQTLERTGYEGFLQGASEKAGSHGHCTLCMKSCWAYCSQA